MSAIFKFIPLEQCFTGSGNEALKKEHLNKGSVLGIRKDHDEEFYRRRESIKRKSVFTENLLVSKKSINRQSIKKEID